ncbi:hypothetical protein M231_06228 [Tremella mesenterica]|uniref:Tetraspanin Tsp2 n=1 Tax=Tremella mesenterica TaxID=5217 RepID=A0A4Q1BDX1_TREME|nr:hypothetical protein M231_06228 [Tremella mesenterica]
MSREPSRISAVSGTTWWSMMNPFSGGFSSQGSGTSSTPLTGDDPNGRTWKRWQSLRLKGKRSGSNSIASVSAPSSRSYKTARSERSSRRSDHGIRSERNFVEESELEDIEESPSMIEGHVEYPIRTETLETASDLSSVTLRRASTMKDEKVTEIPPSEEDVIAVLETYGIKMTRKFPDLKTKSVAWTWERGVLMVSVTSMLTYGLLGLSWTAQILLRVDPSSDVTVVSDPDILTFLLVSSILTTLSALIGLTGILLRSRPILSIYALLLWPTLLSLCFVGYTAYKRGNLQLARKLNQSWSQWLSPSDRGRVQLGLGCCGFYNPLHDATYSLKCYPRSPLPGCKSKWTLYERTSLSLFSHWAFSVIPLHLVNIVISILCSNHVDRRFGTGLTPVVYRLK